MFGSASVVTVEGPTLLPHTSGHTSCPPAQGALPADEEASLIRIALLRCNISKLRTQDVKVRGKLEWCGKGRVG